MKLWFYWFIKIVFHEIKTTMKGNSYDWLFKVLLSAQEFFTYGDVTIPGEGLSNFGLFSALRAFEQGGIFIVPDPLRHGASVFPVLSEGPPHLIASYDLQRGVKDLF
jgi:hypothetical protein